jgi:hypothetical protein
VKVKLAYNRLGFKRTLDEAIRSVLKSQASFLNGCLLLISEDTSLTPTGSDKELYEEELENSREAERLANAEYALYNPEKIRERGENVMLQKRRVGKKFKLLTSTTLTSSPGGGEGNNAEGGEDAARNSEEQVRTSEEDIHNNGEVDPIIAEEDRVLNFNWDGKGRFMDAAKLTTIFRELEYSDNQAKLMLDRLGDEINALQGVYKAILKHRFETECYIRSYTSHIRCLKEFTEKRDAMLAAVASTKKK